MESLVWVCFFNCLCLLCLDQSAAGKITVPTVRQSHGFRKQVTLTLYLPIKFKWVASTPIPVLIIYWSYFNIIFDIFIFCIIYLYLFKSFNIDSCTILAKPCQIVWKLPIFIYNWRSLLIYVKCIYFALLRFFICIIRIN